MTWVSEKRESVSRSLTTIADNKRPLTSHDLAIYVSCVDSIPSQKILSCKRILFCQHYGMSRKLHSIVVNEAMPRPIHNTTAWFSWFSFLSLRVAVHLFCRSQQREKATATKNKLDSITLPRMKSQSRLTRSGQLALDKSPNAHQMFYWASDQVELMIWEGHQWDPAQLDDILPQAIDSTLP